MIRHVIMWKFKPDTQAPMREFLTRLRALVFAAMCAGMALAVTLVPWVFYLVPLTGD